VRTNTVPTTTSHEIHVGDARELPLEADSVDFVVTSPPYPMIEMWDDAFAAQEPAIGAALDAGEGDAAFEAMHDLLGEAWAELERVCKQSAVVAINVGDATRSLDGAFRMYPNAAEITSRMRDLGFSALPDILWRKPTNSAAKFMGSGMLPPNAYPTLEHEHVLLFRLGETRSFPPHDEARYESAYFWEERNEWFTDLWTDVTGTRQRLDGETRERSAAYPLAIPLRLVWMFSTYGDTVLDPFLGTGTTTQAALVAGRDSVGVERDADLAATAAARTDEAPDLSQTVAAERLDRHREFVAARVEAGDPPAYDAVNYDFPVVTKMERELRLYTVAGVEREATERGHRIEATHDPC
jgi:DNA modification methylase